MRFEHNVVFWVAALAVFVALLWLLSPTTGLTLAGLSFGLLIGVISGLISLSCRWPSLWRNLLRTGLAS